MRKLIQKAVRSLRMYLAKGPHALKKLKEEKREQKTSFSSTSSDEIIAPWIKYPEYPVGHPFWRQEGEAWFAYIWQPYWKALSKEAQKKYLEKFLPPEDWRLFYFDREFQKFLDSIEA